MMTTNLRLAALVLALATGSAAAQNVLVGAGANSCGKFIEARRTNNEQVVNYYVVWIQGFLSGRNVESMVRKETMRALPDWESILAYTEKACREAPLTTIFSVSVSLHSELK